ncbi:class I SAM-dependent methyltransferase [Massilia sp. TS11]|uniref:class I SAM-dependent methyltransferase n=1 Tax=Massilia sp. TS11 TaxID=2908003 RepID=UPI001EDAA11C|nr:class I SAM-dependent methyltransferase [Massilia sp. TS11]MCG2584642.1 class I SAM-dependent methyltransferase [Massilia sp. TS11]
MDSAASETSIIALHEWLQSPAGAYVRAFEQECLDALTADIFGFHAVQIGLPQIDALRANRMPHKWLAVSAPVARAPDSGQRAHELVLDFEELPFPSQSLDLVVLPHVLEFAAEPHQVLREVERVLIPEGQLIICGFNPASLWGLRQGWGRITRSPYLPVEGEFISMLRMKDWLKLLNLGVSRSHFGCYAPPMRSSHWLERFAFLESAGQRWWSPLGAVYIVQAVNRVKGMKLIGPAWSRSTASKGAALPVTNRK